MSFCLNQITLHNMSIVLTAMAQTHLITHLMMTQFSHQTLFV